MNHYIISLSLIVLATTSNVVGTVLNTVFMPSEFIKKDEHVEATSHPSEYRYTFDNVNFEIDAKVYEYNETKFSDKNNVINYQRYPEYYIPSQSCYIESSEVTLAKVSVTNASIDQIRAYRFNQDRVFILTGDAISYYALSSDKPSASLELLMTGQLPNLSQTYDISSEESKFASLDKRTYIVDTNKMFLINVKEQGPTATLNLTEVEGYQNLTEYGQLIKATATQTNTLIILSNEDVTEYTCNEPTKCTGISIVNKSKEAKHNYVDVTSLNELIILLDEVQGIFIKNSSNPNQRPLKYPLGYEGKFIKMESIGSTIEVIGQYYGKRYVVELFIHSNDTGIELIVNRFYNQITGLRDVDFFDNKAIFIGDDEIMVIGHSINRNLLTNLTKRQNRQIYLSYGIQQFDVIESISNPRSAYIVGITLHHLILIVLNQTSPSLVCEVDGQTEMYRLLIEINTTNCAAFNWKQWRGATGGSESYCRILQSVNLQVITPVSSKLGLILMISAAVICFVGILVITGFACKFRAIKFRLFQKLLDEIERRRNAVSAQSI